MLLETAYLSPAAGFLALYPVIADEGTPADVTELFRRLSARHPKVAEGQYALAGAALRAENYALALESATRATQLAPYWVPARMLLARTLIANGQDEQGLALALEVVNDNESDVATHLEYALLLSSTGHDEEARAMLTPYASGATVVPGALRALGLIDLQQRRSRRGEQAVRRAALDRSANLRVALSSRRDSRAARGHRPRAAQLRARHRRRLRARRAGARGAYQGR